VTPYEVWFGRKPWWLSGEAEVTITVDEGENVPLLELEEAQESANEEVILSALHKRVTAKQAVEAEKMVKKRE
jgi:hypothetical protein